MIAAAIFLWLGILLWLPQSKSSIEVGFPEIGQITDLKAAFLGSLGRVSDSEALVAGLAIGERDLLSEAAQAQMREISLTHLVAVSGANLAIIMGAIWFLLASLGATRLLRFFVAGISMLCYVLLVGPEPSVLRAGAMALIVLISMALGRGSNPIHALAFAITLLLVVDPSLARNLGFALSALATCGLLLGANAIADKLAWIPRPLALGIGAGVAAQAFTLPVVLMLQPGFPIFAVLANLLVEPVVAPVTVLGIVAVLLIPISVELSNLATFLATFGTQWILWISNLLSSQPTTRFHLVGGVIGGLLVWTLVISLALTVVSRGKLKGLAVIGLTASIGFLVLLSVADLLRYSATMQDWELMACDVGQGDALLIRSQNSTALIDVGREPALIAQCLRDAGVKKIDLLLLTHFDADHVGGVMGLGEISISTALVSGFADDRPLVSIVHGFLENHGVRVLEGIRGMEIVLGECKLVIIGPDNPAIAETSNDASLVSFLDCPRYQVLNLADSSEHSQHQLLSTIRALVDGRKLRVAKVAHHGSKDQLETTYQTFRPNIALYLVGKNTYGHPNREILNLTRNLGATNLRTDTQGAISLQLSSVLKIMTAGKLSI